MFRKSKRVEKRSFVNLTQDVLFNETKKQVKKIGSKEDNIPLGNLGDRKGLTRGRRIN